MSANIEKRRARRTALEAALTIRTVAGKAEPFKSGNISNISLDGAYITATEKPPFQADTNVVVSIPVPEVKRRDFPFSRIAGEARVIRVDELSGSAAGKPTYGIALAFANNITCLTAAPT